MAKIRFRGLDEYERKLSKLSTGISKIAEQAVFQGANVVADEIHKSIEALPIVHGYGTEAHPLPGGVTGTQKAGLLDGFGISKMQNDDGFVNVKLGFNGYNDIKTKSYPAGQPNVLVARGTESGTSWKQKYPFVRPAVSRVTKSAEKVMIYTIEKGIDDAMK